MTVLSKLGTSLSLSRSFFVDREDVEATNWPAGQAIRPAVVKPQGLGRQAAIKGPEIVRGEGRQAYIVYPDGVGRSKLTATLIEKKLRTRATGRNWNTVLKLGKLSES